MEIKKLKVGSLYDALREMKVGEIRLKPDGRSMYTVKKTCSELKSEGYLFATTTKSGMQTIIRLK